jgi:hypothetical protein
MFKDYQPMSKESLLARGCCFYVRGEHSRCYHCPWNVKPDTRDVNVDPRIAEALKSNDTITLYIDRVSLVPTVVLNDRVTLKYLSPTDS